MKLAGKVLLMAGIVAFLFGNSGCKKHHDEPEPVTDKQIDILNSGVWKATTVTLDGNPQAADYTAFTLTFTGQKGQTSIPFTTAGRPTLSPWPAGGNFVFDTTSPETKLSRNDSPPVLVTYAVTSTSLTMSFQFDGNGYAARVGNVKGLWNFTFGH